MLLIFTMITAIAFLVLGVFLLVKNEKLNGLIKDFPRSKKLSILFMSCGCVWFLYRHVLNLGEADFGDYKSVITILTLFILLSSFIFTKDFLAVRGFSIVLLLYSREVLDAAFLQEPQSRLALVFTTYILIIGALYFGAWPYRMRDLITYLYDKPKRLMILGYFLIVNSISLFIAGVFL
tara:strand:+ start:427 stop:963 length:537 start_codon:yes stop_codon:yes gene_type:complete